VYTKWFIKLKKKSSGELKDMIKVVRPLQCSCYEKCPPSLIKVVPPKPILRVYDTMNRIHTYIGAQTLDIKQHTLFYKEPYLTFTFKLLNPH